jgi:ketosteroid isomerase-like protein
VELRQIGGRRAVAHGVGSQLSRRNFTNELRVSSLSTANDDKMEIRSFTRAALTLSAFLVLSARAHAQSGDETRSRELSAQLAAADSSLFAAFNACDTARFASFFTDDVEFYHDKNGLSTSRQALVSTIARRCREQSAGTIPTLRRELVKGSLEVYPLNGYGAIQSGVHHFYQSSNGTERPAEVARFTHVWRFKEGSWKIARELSYDHQPWNSSSMVAISSADLAKYEGLYDIALPKGTLSLRVSAEDGSLTAVEEGSGKKKEPLHYLGGNTFGVSFDPTVRMTFVLDHGRAAKVQLLQGGQTMEGPRRP